MKYRSLLAGFCLLWMVAAIAAVETKEEKFDDGKTKLKFTVDDDGKKQGTLLEYHANGKTKLKAVYKDDELDGQLTEYTEKGKVRLTANYKAGKLHGLYSELGEKGEKKLTANYKAGVLDGSYVRYEGGVAGLSVSFKAGQLAFPRSEEQMTKKLLAIDPPGQKIEGESGMREAALRRLKCYRYVCEVPYENLVLDEEMNKICQAGAELCQKIGRIDHKPPNPGIPEADYKVAFNGTSKSNLAQGQPNLIRAVDSWMDDSDPSNIDRVGHRRWCISPRLGKTGFGAAGKFYAMHSLDQSAGAALQSALRLDHRAQPAEVQDHGQQRGCQDLGNRRVAGQGRRAFEDELLQACGRGFRSGELFGLPSRKARHEPRQALSG
jgi:hypothetical protein